MTPTLPLTLPLELRRDGERLFEISMWCLGRDVNHPEGNLLLRRGLSRERPPEGQKGGSVYTGSLPGGGVLKLWAFGALCGDSDESIYIRRDGFTPLRVDRALVRWPVFEAEALGSAQAPSTPEEQRLCRAAVVTLSEWMGGYEAWVAREVGLSWRSACFAERRKAPPVQVGELADAWWRIAARARSLDSVVNDFTAPAVGGMRGPHAGATAANR
ncbi:hypothetical protein [Hyalangium gracile]|uniref:hypothetical protein n=1 Tax=Hyalangium gracile TaxID=394092 RepID=UPI001CCC4282|nr:hypothetical protein [Hyalangium gracile]